MKQIGVHLTTEASREAAQKLKDFGMNLQEVCRKAMIDKAEELKL